MSFPCVKKNDDVYDDILTKEKRWCSNVEAMCLAGEDQMDKLPLTPTIIVCGKFTFCWCVSFYAWMNSDCFCSCEQYKSCVCACVCENIPVWIFASCCTATRFMLSVDRTIVQENIPSFVSSLCMMFGSYYSFNIHYPAGLASTLVFLQRCVILDCSANIFSLLKCN